MARHIDMPVEELIAYVVFCPLNEYNLLILNNKYYYFIPGL